MTVPPSETQQSNDVTTTPDAFVERAEVALQIEGAAGRGREVGYSILLQGDVEPSSILSTTDPGETVTLLEDNTKLLSGSVRGDTVGFVLDGEVVAAEFDDPEPTVRLGGSVVDSDRWPTVKEYTGFGSHQEPVEDPFPENNDLGKPRGDPLDPREYVVELDASGDVGAYCFDVDGEVLDVPEGATVSEDGERVFGYLRPNSAAEIGVSGVITRIDTADPIGFTVRASN